MSKFHFAVVAGAGLMLPLVFGGFSVPLYGDEPAAAAGAEESSAPKGPQTDDVLLPFDTIKQAGAPNDGIPEGAEVCYYCNYGLRPVVMIFARDLDATTVSLVRRLDEVIQKFNEAGTPMGAFVNLLGDDKDLLKTRAKKLAEAADLDVIPVVVPLAHKAGPKDYELDPDAAVTVLLYREGKVIKNFTFAKGMTPEARNAILGRLRNLPQDTADE